MEIRQFFDAESSAYTYLLRDENSKLALIIDPVETQVEWYVQELQGYTLQLILDTHIHADHITAAWLLKQRTGGKYGLSVPGPTVDMVLQDGLILNVGTITIKVLATPGHTAESVCFLVGNTLFTGDTLLIGKCGRTDFQGGSAGALYDSVMNKLFTLPDYMLIYPGHDYEQRTSSTLGQEKQTNARLAGKTKEEIIQIMKNLKETWERKYK